MKLLMVILALFLGSGAVWGDSDNRWYSADQLRKGEQVFKQNCASCHGQNAEATANWKQTDANGNYPPPPLNGTAHAWHHDRDVLRKQIREGGIKLGGVMPPFEGNLSAEQIDQAIAYFQSKWPDDLYARWAERFEVSALPTISDIEPARKNRVTRYLSERLGNVELGEPSRTALQEVWQVKLQNRYVYLMNDGEFAVIGDLVDLKNGRNLTELARRKDALRALARYSDSQLVVFEPAGDIKSTLNVFTDTSCPYCQKLHRELPRLLEVGIKVRYLPYPRGGKNGPGYQNLRSVWCATDRQKAMTDAKNDRVGALPDGECKAADLVDQGYRMGTSIGITGTPALFKENGEKIEGYVPYQQLIPMLTKGRGAS